MRSVLPYDAPPSIRAIIAEADRATVEPDVLAEEPPRPGNPLLASPHVVARPHIAWLTDGTWRRSIGVIVENCRRLAAGEPLLNRVV